MQVVLLLLLFAFKLSSRGALGWNPHNANSPLVQAYWEVEGAEERLLHLTIDQQSGHKRVYIGAVNRIYQLSSDLKLEAQAIMGPAPDDHECPVTRYCPNVERKQMDYYNKALVIYIPNPTTPIAATFPTNSQPYQNQLQSSLDTLLSSSQTLQPQPLNRPSFLISCGTLFQGSCALHNLDNITNYELPANESVVANSPSASTVAFIAPGPVELHRPHQQQQVLYVGASSTGLGPYNAEVPAVSSRSLLPESMFNFASTNVASGTRLTVNSLMRDRFPITYVYGFSSRGFSYFVTVQKKSTTSAKPFITKLVRVCQRDVNYHSYVEVSLTCRSDGGIDYNLAQAAYVSKPGFNLATSLGITTEDEVLFVVFSKSKDKRDVYNEPGQQSALCVYALPSIHLIFTQNIQHCFNGNGQQGLDYISRAEPCIQTQVRITEDFCGMDVNNLISGLLPIQKPPVIEYENVSLTAVASSRTGDFTVAYLGTSTGQLKRLVVENADIAIEYSNTIVDTRRRTAINPDMKLDRTDKTADFIYVMNDKRVSLIKVHDCNHHKTCTECLGAHDPHCGWCATENRCSTKSACNDPNPDNPRWWSYRSSKCPAISGVTSSSLINPQIMSFVPSKGPKSGGTKLLLLGLNMDADSRAEVFVGMYPCYVYNRRPEKVECVTSPAEAPGSQRVSMRLDDGERISHDSYNYLYVEDPVIEIVTSMPNQVSHTGRNGHSYAPPKGIQAGGISIHANGTNFMSIQEPKFYVVVDEDKYFGSCTVENATDMNCVSPYVPEEKARIHGLSADTPIELDYGFHMDDVVGVQNLATRKNNPLPMFLMYTNPEYKPFPEEVKYYKSDYLTINGSNLDQASSEHDITVKIGNGFCNVTSLSRTQLTCKPPAIQPEALESNQLPDVVVTVGNSLNFTIGKLIYDTSESFGGPLSRSLFLILLIGAGFLVLIVILTLIAYRKKASESSRVVKTMQEQMDALELKVASEAKQAFTELQTEMTDLTDDLEHGGIPYLDYRIYTMKVLFPNSSDHPVLSEMKMDPQVRLNFEKGLASFEQLILNKTFLLLFIRTLESNRYFSMRDRVNVASLIMVTLQNRMEYCTDILKTLLADLIERSMESRSHPKLLLRRTESVAEKMLSSWFTFLLYKFLRECAGEPLFLLYQAIKHQVNKGPVDVITSEARCSLSEEKLIRQSVDYKPITLRVSISPQTAYLSGVDPNLKNDNIEIPVKVLDCDTISQVKDKAIDAIYKSTPFSQRPLRDHLDLEWRASATARVLMSDEDHTNKTEGYWKRLNTLAHYRVPDHALVTLVPKQNSATYNGSMMSDKHRYETLSHFAFSKTGLSSPISRPTSPLNGEFETSNGSGGYKHWHLVRHHDNDYRDGERSGKMVSEIYLTRLLATKGTLQRFVDDLFETIFSTARLTSSLPIAIKYMFDFLDDQARGHGITDPEVVHTWKSNSLPLRFWVNLIKNPNFVFDINKSNIVDSCLSVVAQTFMDACSTSEHRLGKDSPSSKLLYAKDLPIYKDWVERYYHEITMMPPINEHDMNAMLAEESRQHAHEFNTNVSLHELFKYAIKYQEQLMLVLDEDEFGRKFKLAAKLRQTMLMMNGDNNILLQV